MHRLVVSEHSLSYMTEHSLLVLNEVVHFKLTAHETSSSPNSSTTTSLPVEYPSWIVQKSVCSPCKSSLSTSHSNFDLTSMFTFSARFLKTVAVLAVVVMSEKIGIVWEDSDGGLVLEEKRGGAWMDLWKEVI